MLLPPLFPGTESVVVFGACEAASEAAGLRRCPLEQTPRVRFGGVRNNAVKAAFKTAGFRALKSGSIDAEGSFPFNAAWNGALKREDLKRLNRLQRVNHFPGTWELGRKDRLGRNAGRARRRNAEVFDIMPRSFVLPHDADEWRIECDRFPDGMYIIKPPASSRGRGIRMMTRPSDIKPEKDYVIQRYVGDPHLIDGYKYDLRVYVAVTCVDPLRVYVYREGLVRFATERYTDAGEDLKRRCVHLTNYSVNVKTEAFAMGQGAEEDDVGHKWSLSALRRHFEEKLGIGFGETWARIKDVVVKTMMCVDDRMNVSAKMHVPDRRNCYELFGFDVMLDARLKPWLIEVNTGPSLSAPSALDMHIKHRMAANLFNLVGFAPYDRAAMKKTLEERRRARLVGVPRADAIASTKTNAAPPARAFPKTRDAKTLRAIDFDDYALEDLPEVIRDAEAELARAGEFERCFPAPDPEDNAYYLRHFETPRFDNALLCAWEAHKRDVLRRRKKRGGADDPNPNPKPPGSRPGSRAGATRPPSRAAAGGPGPRPRSRLSRGVRRRRGVKEARTSRARLVARDARRLADGHAAAGARDSPGDDAADVPVRAAAAAPGTRGGGEAAATRRAAPRAGTGARHPPAARGLARRLRWRRWACADRGARRAGVGVGARAEARGGGRVRAGCRVRGEGAEREDGEKRSPKGIVCKYFMTDGFSSSNRRASKRRRFLSLTTPTRDEKGGKETRGRGFKIPVFGPTPRHRNTQWAFSFQSFPKNDHHVSRSRVIRTEENRGIPRSVEKAPVERC